jgi:hypothetical protein
MSSTRQPLQVGMLVHSLEDIRNDREGPVKISDIEEVDPLEHWIVHLEHPETGEYLGWVHPPDLVRAAEILDRDDLCLPEWRTAPAGREIIEECLGIAALLLEKNRKYGNSALSPVRAFSKADAVEQIKVRIDDKISRLISAQADEDEDVTRDLVGYLVLLQIARRRATEATDDDDE